MGSGSGPKVGDVIEEMRPTPAILHVYTYFVNKYIIHMSVCQAANLRRKSIQCSSLPPANAGAEGTQIWYVGHSVEQMKDSEEEGENKV